MLLSSLLIGFVAGLRVTTAPAAAAIAARFGWLAVGSTPLAFQGYRRTPWIFSRLALAELVAAPLPSTPSRKVPMQLGARGTLRA